MKRIIRHGKMALDWVDQRFPDAEPGSVQTAIITYRGTPDATVESDYFEETFESLDERINVVTSYEITEESAESGFTAAEDLAVMYPDLNLVITASGDASLGFNNYYTSLSNTREDTSDLGVFGINLETAGYEAIIASANEEAVYRGALITETMYARTVSMFDSAIGAIEGTIEPQTYIGLDLVEVWPDNAAELLAEESLD